MKPLFKPHLVNEPSQDPALYIELFGRKESFIVDLGDVSRLTVRKMLKTSRIFVTHTHIDHFFGFDSILRTSLSKRDPIHIYGPRNIIRNVKGKINGYTWNLIREYPLKIFVHEFNGSTLKTCLFSAANGLKPAMREETPVTDAVIYEDRDILVKAAVLSHKIPVIAYYFEEKQRINVRKDMLVRMELEPGSWLNTLKAGMLEGVRGETIEIQTKNGMKKFTTGELQKDLLIFREGEKILYVTDIAFTRTNIRKIQEIAVTPDLFFCEAFFTSEDENRAAERYHLTSAQARTLADLLGAKKLVIFHFSPRYKGNFRRIFSEAYPDREKEKGR